MKTIFLNAKMGSFRTYFDSKKLIKVLAYVYNDKSNNIPIGKIKTIFLLSKKCLKM